ncbi:hypothetical protein O0L34_g1905 [Tuta absoluta]|nr:hypothetical protein O0L34_g1905 [Tuta absoluta]
MRLFFPTFRCLNRLSLAHRRSAKADEGKDSGIEGFCQCQMMGLLVFVISALCVNFVFCENTYNAAIITSGGNYVRPSTLINEVANLNTDILVLPAPKSPVNSYYAELEDYDEVTSTISSLAKNAGAYVVAHAFEKTLCQDKREIIRNNLVFDRQGSVIAVYRKPLNTLANCTTSTQIPVFTTDFGVAFGLLMENDLVLQNPDHLKLKNFVVAGGLQTDMSFLSGSQFASAWAYVTDANILTASGAYSGKAGFKTGAVVKLNKDGGVDHAKCTAIPSISHIPAEDLSQYIIRPLDMRATVQGHTETVCHGKFCCEFYVKTSYVGSPQHEVSYGLAAFDGIRHYADSHHIGAQSCSIVACAGLYKRSCALGPNNSTNTHFEKIKITGNFTKPGSTQFPLVVSTSKSQKIQFKTQNTGKVTVSIEDGSNVLNFGIFGRDYSKDFVSTSFKRNLNENGSYYDYFFNEDTQEFFDYVWIRMKIMIFIVSIYVLEMM